MRIFNLKCKSARHVLWLVALVSFSSGAQTPGLEPASAETVSRQGSGVEALLAQPKTGKQLAEIQALVIQQQDIATGVEGVAYGRLVAAYSDLFRQREKDDDNKTELARIQKELAAAEEDYRKMAAFWVRAQAISKRTGTLDRGLVRHAYDTAIEELVNEVAAQPARLHRDLAAASDDEDEEARKGAARGRTRTAYLKATVAAEQWAAFFPSIHRDDLTTTVAQLPAGQFSTLLAHMGWLAYRIANTNPNDIVVPVGSDFDTLQFLKLNDRDAALEEYRRLATTGLLVNPVTHKPVEGIQRTQLARLLEANLQEFVQAKGSQQSDFSKLLWKEDDRVRLAKQIEKEIKDSPEYRTAGFLEAGIEPDFKMFFLAAALAVSHTQLQLRERYSKEYLGEGFWNTGLGQLVRANNVVGTGDAGVDEVKKRVDEAIKEGDQVVRALKAAAREPDPALLKQQSPSHYKLLKAFGYIVEFTGPDKKPAFSYRIPGTRRSLGNRLRSFESDAKIPGASVLDVITPKSVAITLASMVIPELGAAWLTSGAAVLTTTSGGLLAIRAVAEMGVGFYMDTALEKCEKGNKDKKLPDGAMGSSAAFLENCYAGKVNYEKLILESVVLGGLIQVSGAKTQELLDWVQWKRQRALLPGAPKPSSSVPTPTRTPATGTADEIINVFEPADVFPNRLYKTLESRLRQSPRDSEAVWKYVGEGIGLAQETAITESFQMISERRDFDLNAMLSTLINNTLSRQMSKHKENLQNILARPDVPRIIHDTVKNDPEISKEVMANHERRVEVETVVRQRYEALIKDTAQPGRKVFESLLNGDLTWTELKNLFARTPEQMGVVMQEVADRREHFFKKIIRESRKRSIEDVEQYFVERIEAAVREAGGREAAFDQIAALEKRRQAELDLINAEIATPGSSNPTSDIDRSSSSAFLRKNLIHMYEAHAGWRVDGDLPTSAKSFDVNEYINIFPFITENSRLVAELKLQLTPDGMPHADYMEAMSLSGGIQHMGPVQAANYIRGQRVLMNKAVAEGRASPEQLAAFERMVNVANATLATSRNRLQKYAEDIAKREGRSAEDPEMQLKAKEFMYDLRMKEIRQMQWNLSELERKLGDQKHPQAIKLRAEIERKMSMAMRDGIETYSYTVGLDIIVNRVQAAKVPKLDKNGEPVIGDDGKPEMRSKTVAERLAEPGFRIGEGGELHMYTEQDMRSVLNDQVMFIAEHINHFNSGHESTYLAGRGIGKYTERAFLALKLQGLDIAEVRRRGRNDPTRRLLELTQKMAELKNDPLGMSKLLAENARRDPKSPENGMAEVFYLIEQVIPGMEGMTGVVPPKREPGIEIIQPIGLNPYARPARNSATQREIQRLDQLAQGTGQQVAKEYLLQEIELTKIEIAALEREIKELQEIGAEFRLVDWDQIRKLKTQAAGLKLQNDSLLWFESNSATARAIKRQLASVAEQLERARTTRVAGDIHQLLMEDPQARGYRRTWQRLEWLRYRLLWLQPRLADTAGKAAREAMLDRLNLSGAWTCGRQNQHSYDLELQQSEGQLTGVLNGNENTGLTATVELSATLHHGALSGFWIDTSTQIEALDLPVQVGPTRMMYEAMAEADGQRFQFVYAPKHPRSGLRLEDVICRRAGSTPEAPLEFLQAIQRPVPSGNTSLWKLKPGEGFVRAMIVSPDKSEAPTGFVLLKGRQRVKLSQGAHAAVAGGAYTIVVRLGGKQARYNMQVAAGVINQLNLNAGSLTVNSLIAGGGTLDTGFRVFEPDDKARQGVLHEGRTGDSIDLSPGKYTVIVGEVLSFPLVIDVTIAAGESHILDARWKQIEVPAYNQPPAPAGAYILLRNQIEGADSLEWHSVSGSQLRKTANGAIVFVPEGTYAAKIYPDRVISDLEAQ